MTLHKHRFREAGVDDAVLDEALASIERMVVSVLDSYEVDVDNRAEVITAVQEGVLSAYDPDADHHDKSATEIASIIRDGEPGFLLTMGVRNALPRGGGPLGKDLQRLRRTVFVAIEFDDSNCFKDR